MTITSRLLASGQNRKKAANLQNEDIVADVPRHGEVDVGVSRYVLGEGEHFAKTIRDGWE